MQRRLHRLAPLLACAVSLLWAPAALAHAQLLGSVPAAGATVAHQPSEVIFQFNQNVGGTLGAVRVYDAQGNEVDDLDVSHPRGHERWMGVGLRSGLPDGTYTATYRVVSADTHIVYGGLVFSIGHPGAAPRFTVAGLIGRNESGEVTALAFGAVRVLDYLSVSLLVGGLAFLLVAWLPALAAARGPEPEWGSAEQMFTARLRRILVFAVALGLLGGVLGILLQGASAAGVSLWASVKATVLESTMESRFGKVWGLRVLDWLALGGLLSAIFSAQSRHSSAAGAQLSTAPLSRPLLSAVGVGAAYLAAAPALSGHASVQSPTAIFLPSDVLHVLAASIWVGGIACLLLSLPRATGQLKPSLRTPLLLAVLSRFSPVALVSVIVIAASGVIQAYIDVRTVHGLLHTTYGALILAKTALLLVLIALGWVNRRRVIPGLQGLLAAARSPGGIGALARRTMRAELALMACVFAATAALISYSPPIDAASGPFSATATLGAAVLEMTVEPAKVGLNTIHLYLIDAKTGAQFTATKELTVSARLASKGIGPLALTPVAAGPGHYVLSSAQLIWR